HIFLWAVLLLARSQPYPMLSELTDDQLTGLIKLCHELMTLNMPPIADEQTRRSTVDIRSDPSASFGIRIANATERARARADRRHRRNAPAYWVYRRQRERCLPCGQQIRTDVLRTDPITKRNITWCPNWQRD